MTSDEDQPRPSTETDVKDQARVDAEDEGPDTAQIKALAPLPAEAEQVIDRLPPEDQAVLRASYLSLYQGPAPNPLLNKVTSDHVGQMLKLEEKNLDYAQADRLDARHWAISAGIVLLVLAAVVLLVLVWGGHQALVEQLVPIVVAVAGGFGGGYGVGYARRSRSS